MENQKRARFEQMSCPVLVVGLETGGTLEIALFDGTNVLGRTMQGIEAIDFADVFVQEILIADDHVSRVHAEIVFNAKERSLIIYDLGSANGTMVDDKYIESDGARIDMHSSIAIGKSLAFLTDELCYLSYFDKRASCPTKETPPPSGEF